MGREQHDGIQVVRAAAALLVVMSHVLRIVHEMWAGSDVLYEPALAMGNVGVYAFFVVSGFVMFVSAGDQFGAPGAPARFLARRIVRIGPMYWLFTGLALVCPFMFAWRAASPAGLALSLAFLPNVTAPGLLPVLPVGWTLSFEMLFYVVFAACLALPRTLGVLALLATFSLLGPLAGLFEHTGLAQLPIWPAIRWWAAGPTLLFVFGAVLAMAQGRLTGFASATRSPWWGPALLVAAPAAAVLAGATLPPKGQLIVAAAAVTLCAMSRAPIRGRLSPLLGLGDASYALYLSHGFVLGALSWAWLALAGPHGAIPFAILGTVASCALAWVLHVRLEAPMTRGLRRLGQALALDPPPDAKAKLAPPLRP